MSARQLSTGIVAGMVLISSAPFLPAKAAYATPAQANPFAATVAAPGSMSVHRADDSFARQLEESYSDIEAVYRPDVRWWLAEGLNTDATLKKNVQEIADSGFGAAEFLAMPENGAPDATYAWGSPEWTADTQLLMEETTKNGLGFSLTSGTNWTTANLPSTYTWDGKPIGADNKASSKELNYATVMLDAGANFNGPLPAPPTKPAVASEVVFQGVVAAKITQPRAQADAAGNRQEGTGTGKLDISTLTDLSDSVVKNGADYSLNWTAPGDGQYALFAYWMHGTGQTATPSVAQNYAINYIDNYGVDALIDYWEANVLTDHLRELVRESGHGEIYMDSLELLSAGAGGTLWGYNFKDEFKNRRGYDITPYLPLITSGSVRVENGHITFDYTVDGAADQARMNKVRNDLFRTLTDMYIENMLGPLQEWLHTYDMQLRAEPSYGTAFEISTPAKVIDGIETESYAMNGEFDLNRGLLGSANMYNRTFSSETGATINRNYVDNMDYYTQLAYLQFAGGVNRTVFHGYSAIEGSDADTYWPGHEGMYGVYSERFNSRQPASRSYPEWTEMLGRNQKVLRQGQAQRDIAILRTDNAFMSYGTPAQDYPVENNRSSKDQAFFWKDQSLQQSGYTYDYFSPVLLEDEDNVTWNSKTLQPNGPSYQAIVLYQDALELSSAKKLLQIAKGGLPVLFVNNVSETRVQGEADVQYGKAASVSKYLTDTDADLKTVVDQIKVLPNVTEVDSQTDAMSALQSHGVYPRVGYDKANNKIMTISRLDKANDILYTFAYSYKYEADKSGEPYSFDLVLDQAGKPYSLDDWSGDVEPIGSYQVKDGKTRVGLKLKPGEATIVALNLKDKTDSLHAESTTADRVVLDGDQPSIVAAESGIYNTVLSDGRTVKTDVDVPASIPLDRWNIAVEDWDAGEKVVNTEEKFGHTTTEVYYETKKTPLTFSDSPLVPWKDLPATAEQLSTITGNMANVSGVGTYETEFDLPASWKPTTGAVLRIGSTNGSAAQVWVNGQQASGLDLRSLSVDITTLLKPGQNTVKVVVPSTLTNRLIQRDYGNKTVFFFFKFWATTPAVQNYGMTGDVEVVPYTTAAVASGTALEAALAEAAAFDEAQFTTTSWKTLDDAVAAAQPALAEVNGVQTEGTQERVDAATNAVNAAILALIARGDTKVLEALIAAGDGLSADLDNFTDASAQALRTALESATAVYEARAEKSQADIDTVATAVQEAIAGLEPKAPATDTSVLRAVYDSARVLSNANGAYTAPSWAQLQTALTAAKVFLDNSSATQRDINAALTNLTTALSGLTPAYDDDSPVQPKVVRVKLNQSRLRLVKGTSQTLEEGVYYAGGLHSAYAGRATWKSSNRKVATVSSNGKVSAKRPGTVTIKVTSTQPSATGQKKSASIKVRVAAKKPRARVTQVTARVPRAMRAGQSVYLTGQYLPARVTGVKVAYATSNPSVADVDAVGRLIAIRPGKTTVTIKAGGKAKTYQVTVR